jgi:hypothetical protein
MAAGPCVAEGACEGVKPSRCPPAGPQVIIMRNAAAPEIEGSLRGNTWTNSRLPGAAGGTRLSRRRSLQACRRASGHADRASRPGAAMLVR